MDNKNSYTEEELKQAHRAITSTTGKCEKALPKLQPGTSQHTLLVRRIEAFKIASDLIERELRDIGPAGLD